MSQETQQQWAGANALGMCAFAMITMILWLFFLGLIPKENTAILFAICFSGGIAQIIAGVIELRRGVGVRGNLLAAMGCLFMLIPGISFLMTVLKLGIPVPVLGYVFMLLGTFMGIWGLGFLRAPKFVFLISPLGVVILFSIGLIELGFHDLKPLAAWTCFMAMLWALWMLAHSLGEFVGVKVPVGKPLSTPKVAISPSPAVSVSVAGAK
ncbi:MAG: GPR1/FUN34/YaaH family transporter [Syntrophorhabdus sp.]